MTRPTSVAITQPAPEPLVPAVLTTAATTVIPHDGRAGRG
jgi:hypothetical protein